MRERREGLLGFSGACKTPANSSITMTVHFSAFQEIYSGWCTVAAQMLRLLHKHKVWDDQHLTCCLEANYSSFVQGIFSEFR
jgi:hypothetical protein